MFAEKKRTTNIFGYLTFFWRKLKWILIFCPFFTFSCNLCVFLTTPCPLQLRKVIVISNKKAGPKRTWRINFSNCLQRNTNL